MKRTDEGFLFTSNDLTALRLHWFIVGAVFGLMLGLGIVVTLIAIWRHSV